MIIGEYEETVEIIPDEEPVPKREIGEREPVMPPPVQDEEVPTWAS